MKKALSDNVILLDEESSSILVASQNAIVITEQVGIHPHVLKLEFEGLIESVQAFNNALSKSHVIEYLKNDVFNLDDLDEVADTTKKWFKNILSY